MPEMEIDIVCPACGHRPMVQRYSMLSIPYFDEAFETSLRCNECRHTDSDVMITSVKEPTRVEYAVDSPDALSARVIRSTSGTVNIPELGFLLEPGTAPDSFVTNVEGVLERFRRVLKMAMKFNEDNYGADLEEARSRGADENELASIEECRAGKVRRGAELMAALHDILEGRKAATLVIDDPYGNSMIIPLGEKEEKKLLRRRLTDEENEVLNKGIAIFDLEEIGEIKEKIVESGR